MLQNHSAMASAAFVNRSSRHVLSLLSRSTDGPPKYADRTASWTYRRKLRSKLTDGRVCTSRHVTWIGSDVKTELREIYHSVIIKTGDLASLRNDPIFGCFCQTIVLRKLSEDRLFLESRAPHTTINTGVEISYEASSSAIWFVFRTATCGKLLVQDARDILKSSQQLQTSFLWRYISHIHHYKSGIARDVLSAIRQEAWRL